MKDTAQNEPVVISAVHSLELDQPTSNTYKHDQSSFLHKYKQYIVIIAAVSTKLATSWQGVFGNYLSYLSSLMTYKNIDVSNADINYIEEQYNYYTDEINWTFSIYVITGGLSVGIGSKIEYHYGPKLSCIIGSVLILLGLITTFLVCEYTANPYL